MNPDQKKAPRIIVIDPGHGSTRGVKGYDPGACCGDRTEADANLEAALTLKALLVERGFRVVLTHDGNDGAKPDLSWRVQMARGLGAVALISLHHDMDFTPPRHLRGVYAAPGATSMRLAQQLAADCLGGGWCKPSSHSRFKALYIDAFPDERPSVMIELDSIRYAAPQGARGKAQRLRMLTPIADTVARFLG